MTFSRRDFLRDSAQALSAAALLGVPALAPAAAKTRIEVQDVNGLALITGGGGNVVALRSAAVQVHRDVRCRATPGRTGRRR